MNTIDEKHNVSLIQFGCGYWGPNLLRNFLRADGCHIECVVETNLKRSKYIAKHFPSVAISQNWQDAMSNDQVDAVAIVTPASTHYELARSALHAGKHVFVEKPLAMNSKEAKALCELSKEKGKILMVGHNFLFNQAVVKAKEYIDSGELGEIYYILSQRLNLGRVRQDVNAMWNLAPHDISIILYWLNERPDVIDATGLTFLQHGIEDVVFINLKFPSKRAAHVHVSWLNPQKKREMIVVGSKKMLVYDDVSVDGKIVIYDKGVDKLNILRDLPDIETFGKFQMMSRVGDILIPKIDFEEPLKLETQHFIDCILYNSPPVTNGLNGHHVVEILESAQKCIVEKKVRGVSNDGYCAMCR